MEKQVEEQILQLFDQSEKDFLWFKNNLKELKEKYDGELIAFSEGKVIAHDKNMKKIIEKIRISGKDPSQISIQFISKMRRVLWQRY